MFARQLDDKTCIFLLLKLTEKYVFVWMRTCKG